MAPTAKINITAPITNSGIHNVHAAAVVRDYISQPRISKDQLLI